MKRIATLVVAIALMAIPASALGSSSTCMAYNPETGTSQPSNSSNCEPGTNTGQLPFTGLDVVLLVVGGGALLGAGFVIRRVSRNLS